MREEEEPVIGRMQGEIDQDVDLVIANHGRGPFVGDAGDIAPMIGPEPAFTGRPIQPEDIGIGVDLEAPAIVLAQEMEDSAARDVAAEIGRDIADAQAPRRGTVVEVRTNMRGERFGMLSSHRRCSRSKAAASKSGNR